ncbi:MAG TPA: transcription termination factor NusA [Candidatus Dormibacteraeota bacterium]
MSTDLQVALEELNRQFEIPLDDLVRALEEGLAAAYRRAFDPDGEVDVTLDPTTGAVAGRLRTRQPDGSVVVTELPGDEFRRLAPQAARHVVLRRLRELERDQVLKDAAEHQGELAVGTVDRTEGAVVHVDLGKAEGLMELEDQVPGEALVPGRPITVVILEGRRAGPSAVVRVSRSTKLFVQRLLEREVPEIRSGAVEVKGIAREPGLRTKVAVAATEPGLDPVGACIGPRGIRHRAILAELGSEHVDIVEWFDDREQFIARALGPAEVSSVELDTGAGTAKVHVPAGQLSLAIGRDGQNARLAAKLTGWRIDIRPDETPPSGFQPDTSPPSGEETSHPG